MFLTLMIQIQMCLYWFKTVMQTLMDLTLLPPVWALTMDTLLGHLKTSGDLLRSTYMYVRRRPSCVNNLYI